MAISKFLEGLKEYISSLDQDKQENIARSLIRRAINEGIDIDRTYDLFTNRGFSIPRDRFEPLYVNTEQRELNSQRVKFINRNQTPSEDILYPSFTLTDRRYRFGVEFDFLDETDDEYKTKFFFIETDKLMTRSQIEELAAEQMTNSDSLQGINPENVRLRYGEINVRSIR